jgi:UDP-N-acetylmuramate--L-alanine ligase/UDP-N-acetylenolpyruvoylglucosamine reductase
MNKHYHLIGIGGIGMSAIAKLLIKRGFKVSGSDLKKNESIEELQKSGAQIFIGHKSQNINGADLIIYSSAIKEDNLELEAARGRTVPIMKRAEALVELMQDKSVITVTGSHGKTTTTSLISYLLMEAGLSPTITIGGIFRNIDNNAFQGEGDFFVAEADESDGSFLYYQPKYSIVTNIDYEHLDYYKDFKRAVCAFAEFINRTDKNGCVFSCNEDQNLRKILKDYKKRFVLFGLEDSADVYPKNIELKDLRSEFDCFYKKKFLGRFRLALGGMHNISNAMAVIALAVELGIDLEVIKRTFCNYQGAERRLEIKFRNSDYTLIDDYAHHPTEIKATLVALKNLKANRLITIFQPHRFSRTKLLLDEFGKSFDLADYVITTDIYPASELALPGISGMSIYESIKQNAPDKEMKFLPKEKIAQYILKIIKPGDLVVTLGAGDIIKVCNALAEVLKKSFKKPISLQRRLRPSACNPRESAFNRLFEKSIKTKMRKNEMLSRHTTLRIGGASEFFVQPRDIDDLKTLLKLVEKYKMAFRIIGAGSNILVSDKGLRGITVSLNSSCFRRIAFRNNCVEVGAGRRLNQFIQDLKRRCLSGAEFLAGIPGTIGGALAMNAGILKAKGQELRAKNIGDLVEAASVMDYNGKIKNLNKKDIRFNYRSCSLSKYIILKCRLKLKKAKKKEIDKRIKEYLKIRKIKQDYSYPSAGCVFKNPPGKQAGRLIDLCGLKGRRIGDACISSKHANFIVNLGRARAKDVMSLINLIKKEVRNKFGINLELEIKIWK